MDVDDGTIVYMISIVGSSLPNDLGRTIGDRKFADLRLRCKNGHYVAAHRLLWAWLPSEWLNVLNTPGTLFYYRSYVSFRKTSDFA
jgi:hypothetical protein